MKRLLIVCVLILVIAPMVMAQYDTKRPYQERRAAKLYVYNNSDPLNAFNVMTVLGMLNEAFFWANQNVSYGHDSRPDGYVDPNAGYWDDAKQALDYWLQNTTGLETGVSLGETKYMENGGEGTDVAVSNPNEFLHSNTYAYDHDLTVADNQHYELGGTFYYFNRPHTTERYDQISLVTEGKEFIFYANYEQSPIVLDMDGDGKLEASNGEWLRHNLVIDPEKLVSFDVNGDGFEEKTEWVGPNDGLLIQYESGDVSIKNLFGDEGGKYKDGYEKLSLLDANKDNKLTGDELKTLSIWLDKNGNAKVDEGEISSLASLEITEIELTHKNLVASFVQKDQRKMMWDWYPATYMVKEK